MATVQLEKMFCFTLYILLVFGCLHLLAVTKAKALPVVTEDLEVVVNETDCNCNRTNLTMTIHEQFLFNWLEFNSHHSIRHLTEAAADLVDDTNDLEVSTLCC